MTMSLDQTCTRSPRAFGVALVGALSLGACVLTGIEPDEIDVADDEAGEAGDETGVGEGGVESDGSGDGDGDESDPTTGDGDGDGDGDNDGDSETGGDGDGDAVPCSELGAEPLTLGENLITLLPDLNDFAGTCGGTEGPDALFAFAAPSEGLYSFGLVEPDFDGVLYLVGENCGPPDELACDAATVESPMTAGQTLYIVVDSNEAGVGGTATLTITGP